MPRGSQQSSRTASKTASKATKATKTTKTAKAAQSTRSADTAGSRKSRGGEAAAGHGSERARDEARHGGGPRYGGEPWSVADKRGEQRFGQARNDDADLSELAPGDTMNDDDELPSAADPDLAAAETTGQDSERIESGGQRAGMGHGEEPRKPASRARK
jgi:hypothetical protein